MKKIIAIILAALTLFALVSCGDGNGEGNTTTDPNVTTNPPATDKPITPSDFVDCDEILLVYDFNGAVKIRTSPEIKSDNLVEGYTDGLQNGTQVRRIGYHKDWSKIVYNGITCYISTSRLVEELPVEITEEDFTPVDNKKVYAYYDNNDDGECDEGAQINLRTAPSLQAASVNVLDCGTELVQVGIYIEDAETGAGWSKVIYNGITCYTRNSCISETKPHTEVESTTAA
jgi:hypothetical protein